VVYVWKSKYYCLHFATFLTNNFKFITTFYRWKACFKALFKRYETHVCTFQRFLYVSEAKCGFNISEVTQYDLITGAWNKLFKVLYELYTIIRVSNRTKTSCWTNKNTAARNDQITVISFWSTYKRINLSVIAF
jgi:hypothetical protein